MVVAPDSPDTSHAQLSCFLCRNKAVLVATPRDRFAKITAFITIMKSADDSLPLMHTHYLSASQLAYCERNPTYTANLTRVKKIQQRVFELQSQLGASRNNPDLDNRALARWRDKINNTEELFMADDDELASLAEALLAKDKFKIEDEVYMIDGRWCWSLPKGSVLGSKPCSIVTSH